MVGGVVRQVHFFVNTHTLQFTVDFGRVSKQARISASPEQLLLSSLAISVSKRVVILNGLDGKSTLVCMFYSLLSVTSPTTTQTLYQSLSVPDPPWPPLGLQNHGFPGLFMRSIRLFDPVRLFNRRHDAAEGLAD